MKLFDIRKQPFEPRGTGPLRLVSLVPSTTESLFALGRGDDLVGYTRFCVQPADQLSADKWIGGTKNPKIEQIIALHPDLVFANREENRAEDVAALEAAGVAVWVAEPRTVAEAVLDLRQTAMLVGRAARGTAWAVDIEKALDALRDRALASPRSVAYLIWHAPWMAAGKESFIAALLAEAGLQVMAAGRYPELSLDEMRGADGVMLSSEPFPFDARHRDELIGAGVAAERVRRVDGEYLSWHGVRLAAGLRYLRELLDDWWPTLPRRRRYPDDYHRFAALARAGEYREALLALEQVWDVERSEFYAGLLQLMVVLNQRESGMRPTRTLRRAYERLLPYAPRHAGLDVAALCHDVAAALDNEGALPAIGLTWEGAVGRG